MRRSSFSFGSPVERRRADLFWADLAGARVGRRRLAPAPAFEGFAGSEDFAEDTELRSWPTLSTLPESIVSQIIANRNRVPSRAGEIRLAPNGYYALGKNFAPSVLVSPQEEQNPRVKEIITRLSVEVGGEGRTASVMTGDAASFTWGVGLAHGGSLEAWVNDWFASTPAAKDALLDLGITLSGTTWKIVDTATRTVKTGEEAIALVNGREPAATKSSCSRSS